MSKIKWGVGSAVVLLGAIAGANFYADQSLKHYYQAQSNSKNLLQMKYEHFQMGALSGSADWQLAMSFDPCQPSRIIRLKGQDKIQRSLFGYKIESQLNLDADQQKEFQKIYQKPISIVTNIGWLGQMKTTITLPKMNLQEKGIKIIGTPSEIKIQSKKVQDQFKIVDFSSYLEKIEMQQNDFKLSAEKVSINSNHSGINTAVLEDGYSKLDVGDIHIFMGGKALKNIQFKDLSWNTKTKLQKRSVDFMTEIGFKRLNVGNQNFSDMRLNFNLTDLNKEKIQNMFDHYDQLLHECQPNTHLNQALEKDLLAVINHGFKFKSEGNQLKSGEAVAKLNVNGRMLPAQHSNPKAFIEAVPNLVEYNISADVDKNLLKTFKPDATSTELDMMVDQLVQKMQAQRKGDSIHISMQYKNGEKKFMKEIPKD